MHPDILELARFYKSPLGRMTRDILRSQVQAHWDPNLPRSMLGLGYAPPFLWPYLGSERVVAAMPAAQGVLRWPHQGPSATCLVHDHALPFPKASFERILLVHALEHAQDPEALVGQAWDVLTGQGELIILVPNRLSVWARRDMTPFGQGRPYSHGQLEAITGKVGFAVSAHDYVLFMPPLRARWALGLMQPMEKLSRRLGTHFGGVHLIKLRKQVFARPKRVTQKEMQPKTAAQPAFRYESTKSLLHSSNRSASLSTMAPPNSPTSVMVTADL